MLRQHLDETDEEQGVWLFEGVAHDEFGNSHVYHVYFEDEGPDVDPYFIEFRELEGCMTQAKDLDQVAEYAEEILTLWLETEGDTPHGSC